MSVDATRLDEHPAAVSLRTARPGDHEWIVRAVDQWWGRPVAAAVPRLFLDHFHPRSIVAELEGQPVGFLIGLHSPADADLAYIHFVGVDPAQREAGLGRRLYERFFEAARADGRLRVEAITAPVNAGSIAFHRRMGFDVSDPIADYNRPGVAHVKFTRALR